jgi:hypothetical protein
MLCGFFNASLFMENSADLCLPPTWKFANKMWDYWPILQQNKKKEISKYETICTPKVLRRKLLFLWIGV